MIDKAKKTSKPIILVTDDRKEDWWLRLKGKTIGPRPELLDEIFAKASVSFYMYAVDRLMEYAAKHLSQSVKAKAISEVREVRETEEGLLAKIPDYNRQMHAAYAESGIEKMLEDYNRYISAYGGEIAKALEESNRFRFMQADYGKRIAKALEDYSWYRQADYGGGILPPQEKTSPEGEDTSPTGDAAPDNDPKR